MKSSLEENERHHEVDSDREGRSEDLVHLELRGNEAEDKADRKQQDQSGDAEQGCDDLAERRQPKHQRCREHDVLR